MITTQMIIGIFPSEPTRMPIWLSILTPYLVQFKVAYHILVPRIWQYYSIQLINYISKVQLKINANALPYLILTISCSAYSKIKLQIGSKQKINYTIHKGTHKVDFVHLQCPRAFTIPWSIYDYSYNFKPNIEIYV